MPERKTKPAVNIAEDPQGWLLDQASALRGRRYSKLDWEQLAEELEDMAALRRDALRSYLTVILLHMLKLAYETRPVRRRWGERQWKVDLVEHRDRINDLLRGSGTLRAEFEEFKKEAHNRARKRAGFLLQPNQEPIGPEECPWSTEQILDEDFFSSAPTT